MVSRDNFSDGAFKTRPVLTDVTNRPTKRPFSSISTREDGDSQFANQVCLGVENLVKKKCQLQFGSNPSLKFPFCAATSTQKSNFPSNVREDQNSLGGVPKLHENSIGLGEEGQGRLTCGVSEERPLIETLSDRATEGDDIADKLAASKGGSVEPPTISASSDSRFLGLERCATLRGDGSANSVVADVDLLKTCTCSFCSKAAYIWSDLHYQDVKGRISAIKKSQKEASAMVQKFSAVKDTVILDQQSNAQSSKLESDLMDQWKSLFFHMENTYAQESKQLESSFETLKYLRENCKNDLDLTDNSHFDNR